LLVEKPVRCAFEDLEAIVADDIAAAETRLSP
jgi:hypothetical protein